jgi:hypothetical protein
MNHLTGKDLTERCNDNKIGSKIPEKTEKLRILQFVGLYNGEMMLLRHSFHRRGGEGLTAASGTVRLGDDPDDGKVIPDEYVK